MLSAEGRDIERIHTNCHIWLMGPSVCSLPTELWVLSFFHQTQNAANNFLRAQGNTHCMADTSWFTLGLRQRDLLKRLMVMMMMMMMLLLLLLLLLMIFNWGRGAFGLGGRLLGISLGLGGLLLGRWPGLDFFHLLALRTRPQHLAYLEVRVTQGLARER